ncbi:hypothetical protein [Altererythrobacter sp. ZODW24]|uniref:hypothetical protein n=1 Tax=Altererythrobacter sp. ZODW24 TaxID=2185142 RepID=UPI000DF80E53|nr:hypothetical protein [Altererythrobacter sp. ZODW24]
MLQKKTLGTMLAATALVTSIGANAQSQSRSASSIPQEQIVHPTMPEDATIVDDNTLDYCFDGDVFSRAGVLLDEAACNKAGALLEPNAAPVAGVSGAGGTSGILIGLLAGVGALVAIVAASGSGDDTPDSPG